MRDILTRSARVAFPRSSAIDGVTPLAPCERSMLWMFVADWKDAFTHIERGEIAKAVLLPS